MIWQLISAIAAPLLILDCLEAVHKKVIQVEYTRASNVFFDVLLVLVKEDVPCFTVMVVFLC